MSNKNNHRIKEEIIMKDSQSSDMSAVNVCVSKKYSLLGQKKMMNCGMEAEVIEDNGYNDITVRFTDGYTTYHRERTAFKRGKISNPSCKIKSILGEKRMMKCGMEAEVIEDNGYKDITIKFSDGTILTNRRRDAFLYGLIRNPNYVGSSIKGRVSMMNCGMEAEVIEDFGSEDITVKFLDGTIKKHCSRHNFFKGKIRNNNLANNHSLPQALVFYFIHKFFPDAISNYRPDWLRNRKTLANLEIDIWIPSKKIGIEYDGYHGHSKETQVSLEKSLLITSTNEIDIIITILERGSIIHTSSKHINYQLDYISEYNEYILLLNQLENTIKNILKYLGITSKIKITDKIIEDLYYNIDPVDYRKVVIDNISGIGQGNHRTSILGQKATMNCGMKCEVIEDKGWNDIIVKFEDGFISKKRTRLEFRRGMINNPYVKRHSLVGKEMVMRNHMKAKVIEDNGAYDIKIQFEDGYIAHCARSAFKKGTVKNPNINKWCLLCQKATMNCGMECVVIEDKGCNDITVEFKDGYIKKTRRQSFKLGIINNPNVDNYSICGLKLMMKCGMEAEVIGDNGPNDITVRFTDGYTTYHRERTAFKRGKISNPSCKIKSILGEKRMMKCGMEAEVIEDNGYKDITIKFSDGTILTNRRRDVFFSGHIRNPNYDRRSIKGRVSMMNCGMEAEVIEDFGTEDITVKFSDGTIKKRCSRHNFIKGKIGNPNIMSKAEKKP